MPVSASISVMRVEGTIRTHWESLARAVGNTISCQHRGVRPQTFILLIVHRRQLLGPLLDFAYRMVIENDPVMDDMKEYAEIGKVLFQVHLQSQIQYCETLRASSKHHKVTQTTSFSINGNNCRILLWRKCNNDSRHVSRHVESPGHCCQHTRVLVACVQYRKRDESVLIVKWQQSSVCVQL